MKIVSDESSAYYNLMEKAVIIMLASAILCYNAAVNQRCRASPPDPADTRPRRGSQDISWFLKASDLNHAHCTHTPGLYIVIWSSHDAPTHTVMVKGGPLPVPSSCPRNDSPIARVSSG